MDVLAQVPAEYREAIHQQMDVLSETGHRLLIDQLSERWMPKPLWAEREMDDDPVQAFDAVRRRAALSHRPFCIYLHIPYCVGKCGYCDCYAFPISASRQEELQQYPDLLCQEAKLWGSEHLCQ